MAVAVLVTSLPSYGLATCALMVKVTVPFGAMVRVMVARWGSLSPRWPGVTVVPVPVVVVVQVPPVASIWAGTGSIEGGVGDG